MISWASKRKFMYFAGLAILILVFVGIPLFLYLNQPPTSTAIRRKTEPKNNVTRTSVRLRKPKSMKEQAKKAAIETVAHIICLLKKLLSPPKEYIVTSPAPMRGRTEKKSIQSICVLEKKDMIHKRDVVPI